MSEYPASNKNNIHNSKNKGDIPAIVRLTCCKLKVGTLLNIIPTLKDMFQVKQVSVARKRFLNRVETIKL